MYRYFSAISAEVPLQFPAVNKFVLPLYLSFFVEYVKNRFFYLGFFNRLLTPPGSARTENVLLWKITSPLKGQFTRTAGWRINKFSAKKYFDGRAESDKDVGELELPEEGGVRGGDQDNQDDQLQR